MKTVGVGGLSLGDAPGVAFGSPWADTGSPLVFLGSFGGDLWLNLVGKSMERVDAEGMMKNDEESIECFIQDHRKSDGENSSWVERAERTKCNVFHLG